MESDYKETAVRLQKEWNIQNPQDQLPFAPHVQNHALVDILNRGLLYNVQERDAIQAASDAAVSSTVGFFGPLESPSPAADEELENARKRQIDHEQSQIQSGPPAKKARLSNGYESEFEPTPMDVDDDQNQNQNQAQNGDENAYPSPEQLPSPVVATTGPSEGTQVEKVNDLSTDTNFLELAIDPSSNGTVLLQCEFHPQDPTILAAAGTDALARMWRLSRTMQESGSESPGKPIFVSHNNLLDDNISPASTTVTGVSWSSDGFSIAVASEPTDDSTAKVEFWTSDGKSFASFNQFDSPIICLRWNPNSTACLTLSPINEGRSTSITVMSPTMGTSAQISLPHHSLVDQSLDVAWTTNEEFFLCGGDILQGFKLADGVITADQKLETRDSDALSKVTYDWRSRMIATTSDSGTIDIWDHLGQHRSLNAHQGLITSLIWQPMPSPFSLSDGAERLLASAGEDGAISIWNARSPASKPKYSMTMNSGVVAMAFTPDGAFLAGATNQNVFIWKTDDVNTPCATWTRGDDAGWRTPQSTDSSPDEDQFSLGWDAHGQKLAYGVNSRLAIINFRR